MSAIEHLERVFELLPGRYLLLAPDLRIVGATNVYLEATKTRREEIVGRNVFDVFPENPNDPNTTDATSLRRSFERALATKRPDVMPPLKYGLPRPDGTFEEHYWSVTNTPVLKEDGSVAYILNAVEDITDQIHAKVRMRELAAPVIRVRERVLLLPLVGTIDRERNEQMMQTVLERVVADGARVLIIDVAGAGVLDTAVADSLIKLAMSVRLLGCDTILSGIGPAAAKTMVQLGIDVSSLHTCGRLSEGILMATRFTSENEAARS